MCAIIASFSKETFNSLYDLNVYRGNLTSSVAVIDRSANLLELRRERFRIDLDSLNVSCYYIGHTQAPTSQSSSIHPAEVSGSYLWHNGLLKSAHTKNGKWDTELICETVADDNWKGLSDLDGSFACVYLDRNNLYVFRNEISPLYYDSQLNFSSTRFDNSESLEPNSVFKVDLNAMRLEKIDKFETKNNPYGIFF